MKIRETEGPSWWFHTAGAGTMQSSGLQSLLEATHLSGPEVFVREATQNSVDAASHAARRPVRLTFSSFALTPSQNDALHNFLVPDDEIRERVRSVVDQGRIAPDGGFFLRGHDGTEPTNVLLVEDFETKGLGGDLGTMGPDDHFSRLVYFFGQSHGEGNQGGAYGFGKSAYSVASDVRTVVYYSKPENGSPSRLIAVALLPEHRHGGKGATGFALCGLPTDDPDFPIAPVEGEAADELAASIGMSRRDETSPGTSVFVVDARYDVNDLRRALERWWWPRLVTTGPSGLTAEFKDHGHPLPPPAPSSREDLAPFVRAFQHLLDARDDTPETKTRPIRSIGKRVVGKAALRRIDADPDPPDDDDPVPFGRHVALLRGPRLVVSYLPAGRDTGTPFAGVFVADDAMDAVLRRAENPAHDNWSPESTKLEGHEPTYVRSIAKGVTRFASEFQDAFESKPLPSTSKLRALEDLLGRVFASGSSPGPVPQGPERPVSLSIREQRDPEQHLDRAYIDVEPRFGDEAIPCRMRVSADLMGDAHLAKLDPLEVTLFDEHGTPLADGLRPEHAFVVEPGDRMRFRAEASPPADAIVKFSVTLSGRDA